MMLLDSSPPPSLSFWLPTYTYSYQNKIRENDFHACMYSVAG